MVVITAKNALDHEALWNGTIFNLQAATARTARLIQPRTRLAHCLNHFMQTILLGIPGTVGSQPR